jgi:hypothetical protein
MTGTGDGPGRPMGSADGRDDGAGAGERARTDADIGSGMAGGDDATNGVEPVGGRRWSARRAGVAAGIVAVAVLVGGVAAAARGVGDSASPTTSRPGPVTARSTTTPSALVPTTSSTAPTTTSTAPTTAATTPSPPGTQAVDAGSRVQPTTPTTSVPSSTRCGPLPWPSSGGSIPPVGVPPGYAAAYGPATAACSDTAEGCSVSFTLRWTDGYAETRSEVLTSPGTHTLSGDRGTSWNFAVNGDLYCSSSGGTYTTVWPRMA